MNLGKIFKTVIYAILIIVGLTSILTPYVNYEKAYFVGDDYYISMVDSVSNQYEPYIEDLIQSERSDLALKEKKELYAKLKFAADSLGTLQSKAEISKDSARIANIGQVIDSFNAAKYAKEDEIDQKYSIENMDKEKLAAKKQSIMDTLSLDKYVLIVANEMRNPNKSKSIKPVDKEKINIQKVNLQDKGGFILFGLTVIGIVVFILLMDLKVIPLHLFSLRAALIVVLFSFTGLVIYLVWKSLIDDIRFKEVFEEREVEVKDRLTKIKDLEIEYLSSNARYCRDLDSLIYFAKKDSSAIVRYLVDKNDTAAVNNALRAGRPLKDTTYVPVDVKVFGKNHSVQLDSLPFVPYSDKRFEIKVDQVERNGRPVNLILVKTLKKTFVENLDIYPENFDEEVTIQFGSLADPTTNGNWE